MNLEHMAADAALDADQNLVNTWLARAVAEFDTNRLSAQMIRRLASELPGQFVTAGMMYLDSDEFTGAHRFLFLMMLRQPVIFERLTDPEQGPCERSVRLLKRLLTVDPACDVTLARRLPDRAGANHPFAFEGARVSRTLEILDQTSPGRRLLPTLAHLANSADPVISAKATLFVGRRVQNPSWTARQLMRPDPRVRANAVEAIWGLNSQAAMKLMETCIGDKCNRVIGNALVGLHMGGNTGVLNEIRSLAARPDPGCRATGAWTMGRIGDPAFLSPLKAMEGDAHPQVRGAALRAAIAIQER